MEKGYARNSRDEERLIAAGLRERQIYLEGRGNESFGKWKMRKGEELGVVNGLRALGDSRQQIVARVSQVHQWGAVVVDAETGKRSDRHGVEMLDEALARIKGERTIGSRAKDMQAASVKARTKGRMPQREAMAIWRDPALTGGEAIQKMTGWERGTAYKTFGKRGVPVGRRAK
jgi:hypothetical protein